MSQALCCWPGRPAEATQGPSAAVLERQWWADAPVNDGSLSFDGALKRNLRAAPAWLEGFSNEKLSCHYHLEDRCSRLPPWARCNHQASYVMIRRAAETSPSSS